MINLQFSTSYHIAKEKKMTMPTHCNENAGHREQFEHFFAGLRLGVFPPLRAIGTFQPNGIVVRGNRITACFALVTDKS